MRLETQCPRKVNGGLVDLSQRRQNDRQLVMKLRVPAILTQCFDIRSLSGLQIVRLECAPCERDPVLSGGGLADGRRHGQLGFRITSAKLMIARHALHRRFISAASSRETSAPSIRPRETWAGVKCDA